MIISSETHNSPFPLIVTDLRVNKAELNAHNPAYLDCAIEDVVSDDDTEPVVHIEVALVEYAEDREEEEECIKEGHPSERRRVRAVCLSSPQPRQPTVEVPGNVRFVSVVASLFF